uniref:Alcohol dehydrogenase n=1 Tax=Coccidioides posadasii RMSCC 3488 TaxID=454284 RepID=A0A0J6FH25_COCPO|nr:alcohol dehydrogenase [Coccidioides posadasii RMSCC 3488]
MGDTMRAVDVKGGTGPASALFINPSVPKPKPSATECLVRVKAFGLNRADTLQRQGNYPPLPGITNILGLEVSGVVEEVGAGQGEDAPVWNAGDEVFGLLYGGGYAEYVVVDKKMLIKKPKDWNWEYAAGLCEVWFTALQALYLVGGYDSQRTRSILWHAGASSVSIAGIQLSRNANHSLDSATTAQNLPSAPKVFATSRTDAKCTFCIENLHCTGAVNTNNPNWVEEIKKQNDGNGIDLVIDFVGASYFQSNLDVLGQDGRVVILGLMGGVILPDKVNIAPLLRKRARVEGSTLRSRDLEYQVRLRDLFVEKVMPGLIDGTYKHHTEKVFDWADVGLAHQMMERNETKGKLICIIGST